MAKSLKGVNTVVAVRRLTEAGTSKGYVIPFQTDGDFTLSRDSDSDTTKSGTITSAKGLEVDFTFTTYDSDDPVLDVLADSLRHQTTLEFWLVKLDRKNSKGQVYADYMQGVISKDDQSSDPEKASERKWETAIDGEPQSGYTTLPADITSELSYIFRGLDVFSSENNGNGEAYDMSKIATPQPTTSSSQASGSK